MSFYTATGAPGNRAQGSSAAIRAEFLLIQQGFAVLPSLAIADALKPLRINAAGTAIEPYDASTQFLALGGGTLAGTLKSTATPLLRGVKNVSTIEAYNDTETVRTGYLQFSASGLVSLYADAAATNGVQMQTAGGGTLRMDQAGRVGIGITPQVGTNLSLDGGATTTHDLFNATTLAGGLQSVAGAMRLRALAAASLDLLTAGSVRMSIAAGGDITLNNPLRVTNISAPSTAGSYSLGSDPLLTSGGLLQVFGSASGTPNIVLCKTANVERWRTNATGETGFGLVPSANYRVDVAGTIRTQGGEGVSGYGLRVLNAAGNGGGHLSALVGSAAGLNLSGDGGPLLFTAGSGQRMTLASTGLSVSNLSSDSANTISAISGALNKYAAYALGRTGSDGQWAVAGQVNNFFNGVQVGDVVLQTQASALWVGTVGANALQLVTNNVGRLNISGAGLITDVNGLELGYKGTPASSFVGGVLPESMNGRRAGITSAVTLNTGLSDGHTCSLFNLTAGALGLNVGSAGLVWLPSQTSGSRTLAPGAWVTLLYNGAGSFYVTGVGIS